MLSSTQISDWVKDMKHNALSKPEQTNWTPEMLANATEKTFGEKMIKDIVYAELYPYFCNRSVFNLSIN